jgi:hypothetical protein
MSKIAYPEKCEMTQYSKYHTDDMRRSKYIKNSTVMLTGPGTMTCPRCNMKATGLKHGEHKSCEKCKLQMQLFGNALYIWE